MPLVINTSGYRDRYLGRDPAFEQLRRDALALQIKEAELAMERDKLEREKQASQEQASLEGSQMQLGEIGERATADAAQAGQGLVQQGAQMGGPVGTALAGAGAAPQAASQARYQRAAEIAKRMSPEAAQAFVQDFKQEETGRLVNEALVGIRKKIQDAVRTGALGEEQGGALLANLDPKLVQADPAAALKAVGGVEEAITTARQDLARRETDAIVWQALDSSLQPALAQGAEAVDAGLIPPEQFEQAVGMYRMLAQTSADLSASERRLQANQIREMLDPQKAMAAMQKEAAEARELKQRLQMRAIDAGTAKDMATGESRFDQGAAEKYLQDVLGFVGQGEKKRGVDFVKASKAFREEQRKREGEKPTTPTVEQMAKAVVAGEDPGVDLNKLSEEEYARLKREVRKAAKGGGGD